ncbi:hypothetical protein bcere0017_7650 [Bacillus cereus Rock1-3]|nr:hypothetical protein bcere0017_7650 [Bacillus cereus Rock1-3]
MYLLSVNKNKGIANRQSLLFAKGFRKVSLYFRHMISFNFIYKNIRVIVIITILNDKG